MLEIIIPGRGDSELWDEKNSRFVTIPAAPEQKLQLEHSLVSLQRWESKWCKAFLSKTDKTSDEIIDYIRCMTVTPDVDPDIYARLTQKNLTDINEYINAPMTATTVSEDKNSKKNRETVTAELIYYWMIALNIPFECQKWHLNRLLTLIKVCNIKNQPPKKMNRKQTASQYAQLNAARRKQFNSRG